MQEMTVPQIDLQFQIQEIEKQMKVYFPFEKEWIGRRNILKQYKEAIKILEGYEKD